MGRMLARGAKHGQYVCHHVRHKIDCAQEEEERARARGGEGARGGRRKKHKPIVMAH